ncbi:MAG: sulfurtransferase TusA family protein [Actinobacteria bacterium]|uniref:Sulfurtransferase TusA family protein n=1 Tax=Candidatus Fonsibacter lacus TaxID=2576439 RepID=A0A965GBU3_9PROT|nr:sulfurtransferase TusA family protein [Candidatus Fonsibacter lacus]
MKELDCLGELCPTPIIQLGKAIKEISIGEIIILKADDPATESDLQAWARMTGHSVDSVAEHTYKIIKI